MMGSQIYEAHLNKILNYIEIGKKEGATGRLLHHSFYSAIFFQDSNNSFHGFLVLLIGRVVE